ncbi:MAG: GNAT family N-acetyltransferase [Acidobacteriota bacterium]|nr:GNAT family N-acetyltransferase [Acidobacteriota bacterium]
MNQHAGARPAPVPLSISLRSYAPPDFNNLYAIDQMCYDPRIAYSRTELRQYLGFPGADCVVAETSRNNSAPAMIGFCITAHEDHWGYIITMDVLSDYRRHGCGSMLLLEAEKRLTAAGVRQIGLETATNNSAAIAFWQKHGYRKSGVRRNYYPGGRDAYSMAKRLAGSEKVNTGPA